MSDRALRRLAGKLAALREEDIEAVLSSLEPPHRRRVAALLAEHGGASAAAAREPAPATVPPPDLTGLSSWLAARAGAAMSGGAVRPAGRRGPSFALTQLVLEALRVEVERLPARPPAALPAAGPLARLLRPLRRHPG